MSPKRQVDDLRSPTSTSSKRSRGKERFYQSGLEPYEAREAFEARFGKLVDFPTSVYKFFSPEEPQAAGPLPETARDERVREALLQLVSQAVVPFRSIICTGTCEEPLRLFFAFLLAAFRHDSIVISAEGLDSDDEEERDVEDDPEETEETPRDGSARPRGPVKLVVIKADRETPRETALSEGLRNGLEAGCVAVGAIEVKANVVFNINIWQALGEGIELARWNHKNKVSVPVRIILTDTRMWYFFSLAVKDSNARPFNGRVFKLQKRDCDEEAAKLQKRDCNKEAARPDKEEDKEEAEEFYLFDCIKRYADVLDPDGCGLYITEAMYLFYTALFPDEDISQLPTRIQQGGAKAKEDADAWVRKALESLRAKVAEAKAAIAQAERRRRMAAEKKAAKAEEKAAKAEEKAAKAEEKAAEARRLRMALAAELAQLKEQLAGATKS
ncbi:hypothetical protein GPECTOR_774g947 [Gonium pectorale]|uniref:Uncharacterized protein n=1 Tax=Gonium pectorale TaxID=33097 RepID=A0A150FU40_GONPE|nr:hypothetical protein GPECTOR_774g947 [Gonium pectorale]|eukprot:KXZ41117.1 hypothetical protein GPECTOR_774g947 [Gonium pectorale]